MIDMSRIRLAGIIPMKGGFALMHRKDVLKNPDFQEYYVFQEADKKETKHMKMGH